MLKRLAATFTHRITEMPVLVLMPHSRCNCRCVMCDIWKANHEKKEITVEQLQPHLETFKRLNVKQVALSGGEALMHPNLWKLCEALKGIGAKISLLSTGLLVKAHAEEIVRYCDDLIISIDGDRDVHNQIRNIPHAFEKLKEGVEAIKNIDAPFRVTGRSVLQKSNFRNFIATVKAAKEILLDQISFLAADVSSPAFNRAQLWTEEKKEEVALSISEADELQQVLEESFHSLTEEYQSKFIAESQAKLLSFVQHFKAGHGQGSFPVKKCNAPWVSAVIESNGDVMPCFFLPSYGNIHKDKLDDIINSKKAISFRKHLDVKSNPVCQRCVCSLNVGLTQRFQV
jgi:MoaA/NifB/PqqE/SkfB family radical SAM enzyme